MLSSARSIVFHSYKGGTGKTTIAANVGALLAKKGCRVLLLDLDVYAPSLHSYFDIEPNRWINDFLLELAEVKDVIVDVTSKIPSGIIESDKSNYGNGETGGVTNDEGSPGNSTTSQSSAYSSSQAEKISGRNNHYDQGKLWLAFANPQKEEVYKLEGGKQERVQLIRRFIAFREELFSNFDIDYLIIDTSPGIRYWSLNALAAADLLYLTLKAGDLDVAGTKKMASDIYSTFSKYGAQSYLLLNRVAGYCVPHTLQLHQQYQTGSPSSSFQLAEEQRQKEDFESAGQTQNDEMLELSQQLEINVISALPCYCDIQFSKKEFLTALRQPNHPFAKKIADLAEQSQIRSGGLR